MGYGLPILHHAEHQFVIVLTKQLLWKAVVYSAQHSGFLERYFTPKHSSSVIPNGGCRLLHPAPLAMVGSGWFLDLSWGKRSLPPLQTTHTGVSQTPLLSLLLSP